MYVSSLGDPIGIMLECSYLWPRSAHWQPNMAKGGGAIPNMSGVRVTPVSPRHEKALPHLGSKIQVRWPNFT